MLNGCCLLPGAEFYIAIDNKGNWPNLTLLPNGDIVAAVYNHPSHGFGCGDVECWMSFDGGRTWTYRSTVSDHSRDPEVVRMNHAVGMNANGELVALVSGWSNGRMAPTLPVQVCISTNNGLTWKRHEIDSHLMPFGDLVLCADGILAAAMHDDFEKSSYILRSTDGGRTWPDRRLLEKPGDETALLRCRDGRWLAAMRTWPKGPDPYLPSDEGLQLFTSADEGQTWGNRRTVSLSGQAPAHLLELSDGKILLTYGSRIPGLFGAVARVSKDGGDSWSPPCTLVSIPGMSDCGYPSSVELEDGTIVTAYYFGPKLTPVMHPCAPPWHQRYHMGVGRWRLELLDRVIEDSISRSAT